MNEFNKFIPDEAIKSVDNQDNNLEKTKKELFEKTDKFPDLAIYEYLGTKEASNSDKEIRKNSKKEFILAKRNNDRIFLDNFRLNYPMIDNPPEGRFKIDYLKETGKMQEFRKEVENIEDDATRLTYLYYIDSAIDKMNMLQAIKEKDDDKFFELSQKIYNNIDKNIFDFTISEAFQKINKFSHDEREEIKKAYQNIINTINFSDKSDIKISDFKFDLEANDLKIIGQKTAEYLALGISQGNIYGYDIYSGKKIDDKKQSGFEHFVENELKKQGIIKDENNLKGIDYKLSLGEKSFSYNSKEKIVKIPEESVRNWIQIRSVAAHEVGHAKRAFGGIKSDLKPLEDGLPGYLSAEEGLTTLLEKRITGKTQYAGFDGYFAIGLAEGADGKKRNFEEVYDILKDFYFLDKVSNNPNIDLSKAREDAENKAIDRCERTFRGVSDLSKKGIAFNQDLAYREGSIKLPEILQEVQDKYGKEGLKIFYNSLFLGKWSPFIQEHYPIIMSLDEVKNNNKLKEILFFTKNIIKNHNI